MKTTSEAATRVHAVIPAAGRGVRFGSPSNKVLQKLHGRPIIEWTVEAIAAVADEVTVVAGADDIDLLKTMLAQDKVRVTLGGQTRQESVWLGLHTIEDDDTIALVHDAARPLVSSRLISECIKSAKLFGSGVAALPVFDALKSSVLDGCGDAIIKSDIDREGVWAMQTPQAFQTALLREAHREAQISGFVGADESALVQRLGNQKVRLVYGERINFKITTAEDLDIASKLSGKPSSGKIRVGFGYDIHRLVEGRELWLGGVHIPSEMGLDGHSDADVVLHAICDSLLGAAGLSDIGHMFPNTEPQFRGISSVKLLERVSQTLTSGGWCVSNVDAMLIAEHPKIAPYISKMKSVIAEVLLVTEDQISVKATTNEGVGSLGAGQAMACHATACIIG